MIKRTEKNHKNFRLVGSKLTQSWLYEDKGSYFLKTYRLSFIKDLKVESLEFSHDQKVIALEYDNARNDYKMLAIFKQIPERKGQKGS
ncbi:hypothetical protein BpHYR1_009116 [Brachionus plicatilis]|uniref:Uncharacterized protein n=1 Tax=Brachionus plicatilis TaxID=10195 RepID=A0A3M7SFF4_BRAPC|nr:hypothetical protein BpHYR1_009116 [Brachionus plicatilis]